jgi:hypothetical protein
MGSRPGFQCRRVWLALPAAHITARLQSTVSATLGSPGGTGDNVSSAACQSGSPSRHVMPEDRSVMVSFHMIVCSS